MSLSSFYNIFKAAAAAGSSLSPVATTTTAGASSSSAPNQTSPLSAPISNQVDQPPDDQGTTIAQTTPPPTGLDSDSDSDSEEQMPPGGYNTGSVARSEVNDIAEEESEGDQRLRKGKERVGLYDEEPIARHVAKRTPSSGSSSLVGTSKAAKRLKPDTAESTAGLSSEREVAELNLEVLRLRRQLAEVKNQLQAARGNEGTSTLPLPDPALAEKVEKAELVDEADELEELKKTRKKDQEFRDAVQNTLQCHVCFELLVRPHALNPCGHVCCLGCLQDWFGSAEEANLDEDKPSEKLCPFCRAQIHTKPVELFIVKNLLDALAVVDESVREALEEQGADADGVRPTGEDPWKGMFDNPPERERPTTPSDDSDREMEDEVIPFECDNCGSTEGLFARDNTCVECGALQYLSDNEDVEPFIGDEEMGYARRRSRRQRSRNSSSPSPSDDDDDDADSIGHISLSLPSFFRRR